MAYDWEGVRTRRLRWLKVGIVVWAIASAAVFSIPRLSHAMAHDVLAATLGDYWQCEVRPEPW
jgi:hypothetical protein